MSSMGIAACGIRAAWCRSCRPYTSISTRDSAPSPRSMRSSGIGPIRWSSSPCGCCVRRRRTVPRRRCRLSMNRPKFTMRRAIRAAMSLRTGAVSRSSPREGDSCSSVLTSGSPCSMSRRIPSSPIMPISLYTHWCSSATTRAKRTPARAVPWSRSLTDRIGMRGLTGTRGRSSHRPSWLDTRVLTIPRIPGSAGRAWCSVRDAYGSAAPDAAHPHRRSLVSRRREANESRGGGIPASSSMGGRTACDSVGASSSGSRRRERCGPAVQDQSSSNWRASPITRSKFSPSVSSTGSATGLICFST